MADHAFVLAANGVCQLCQNPKETHSLTTDRNDPRLGHGVDTDPVGMHEVYLVLSEEERAKGFVRPLRRAYIHVGPPGPQFEIRDLTAEEKERYSDTYVKFEPYPEGFKGSATGSLWTQARLEAVGKGCGAETRMGLALCETYARSPSYYGATLCVNCGKHLPVEEFVWVEDGERLGT